MRKIVLNILAIFLILSFASSAAIPDESKNETELNIFTGLFDFSDHKQKAGLLGCNTKMKIYLEKVFWENYLL